MANKWNWHPSIREKKGRKLNPYNNIYEFVLDDLEYTDYYKDNAPNHNPRGSDEYAD